MEGVKNPGINPTSLFVKNPNNNMVNNTNFLSVNAAHYLQRLVHKHPALRGYSFMTSHTDILPLHIVIHNNNYQPLQKLLTTPPT